jgi:hypothetical protein
VIIAGFVLIVLGLLLRIPVLWYVGIVVVIIGGLLLILGMTGRPVGGRRHYW